MKILITLHEPQSFFGGVETWAATMRSVLEKLGHEVQFFPFEKNGNRKFDLILCNTNKALRGVARIKGKKIFICHGILPRPAQPVKGADVYIAVSEETADHCRLQGFPIHSIIRNPIDCSRFAFVGCGETPETIAFFDRRRRFRFARELRKKGFTVVEVGHPPVSNPEFYLCKADLVVARGRGAYEAMAMGKNVIVSGNNSGRSEVELMDGFVDDKTFFEFRENNLSGRCNCIQVSLIDVFMEELRKYNSRQGKRNRSLMLTYNDATGIAEQFLELAGYSKTFQL